MRLRLSNRTRIAILLFLFFALAFIYLGKLMNFGRPYAFVDFRPQTTPVVVMSHWPQVWKSGYVYTMRFNKDIGEIEETLLIAPIFPASLVLRNKYTYFIRPVYGSVYYVMEDSAVVLDEDAGIMNDTIKAQADLRFDFVKGETGADWLAEKVLKEYLDYGDFMYRYDKDIRRKRYLVYKAGGNAGLFCLLEVG